MPPGRSGNVGGQYYGLTLTPEEEALLYGDPAAAPPPPQGGGYATEPQGGNEIAYSVDSPEATGYQYGGDPTLPPSQPYQAAPAQAPALPSPDVSNYNFGAAEPYGQSSYAIDKNGATLGSQNAYSPPPMATYIEPDQRNSAGIDNIQQAPELNLRSTPSSPALDRLAGQVAQNNPNFGMPENQEVLRQIWGRGKDANPPSGETRIEQPFSEQDAYIADGLFNMGQNNLGPTTGAPPRLPGPRASRSARDEPALPSPTAAASPPSWGLGTPTLDWMMDAQQEAEDMGLLEAAGNVVPAWVGLITHDPTQADRARQVQDAMGQTDSSPAGRAAKEAVDTIINPTVERIAGALTQGVATSAAGNTSIPRAQRGTPRSSWGFSAQDRRNQSGAIESLLRSVQPPAPTNSTAQGGGGSWADVFLPLLPQSGTAAPKQSPSATPTTSTTPTTPSRSGPAFANVSPTNRLADPSAVRSQMAGPTEADNVRVGLEKDGLIDAKGNWTAEAKSILGPQGRGWLDASGNWTEKAVQDGAITSFSVGRPNWTSLIKLNPDAAPAEFDPANDPNATTPSTNTASNDSGWVDYGSNKKSGWVDYGSGGGRRSSGGGWSSGGSGGGWSGGGGFGGDMSAALAFLGDDFMGGRFKDMMSGGSGGDMSWESFLEDMDGDGEFSASEIKAAKRKSKLSRSKGSRSRRTKMPSTSGRSANFSANGAIRKDVLERVEGMTPSTGGKKKKGP